MRGTGVGELFQGMEASVDSGRGVSLLCCEKLDGCRAYADPDLLEDGRVLHNLFGYDDLYRLHQNYFELVQDDIKPYMRKIVSDWMLEVCFHFYLVSLSFLSFPSCCLMLITLMSSIL